MKNGHHDEFMMTKIQDEDENSDHNATNQDKGGN